MSQSHEDTSPSEQDQKFSGWEKFGAVIVVLVVLTIALGLGFRVFCVTMVDNYEMAFIYDRFTGKIEKVSVELK